jgi:hypothetical protein
MLAIITNPGAQGDIFEPVPVYQGISHRLHFYLTELIAERGKNIIAATIELTWMESQELFAMVQDNLRQIAPDDAW